MGLAFGDGATQEQEVEATEKKQIRREAMRSSSEDEEDARKAAAENEAEDTEEEAQAGGFLCTLKTAKYLHDFCARTPQCLRFLLLCHPRRNQQKSARRRKP